MTFGDVRVIYLAGMGRSGSTLAERLVGELPGVCVLGEVVHLWQRGVTDNERCGCGTEFGRCEFWSAVADAAFGGWSKVDVARIAELRARVDRTRFIPRLARRSMPDRLRRDLAEYTDYYARLYQAVAGVSGCRTVVDSSKHASLAFCLSRRGDIDLRVIHVVRDSRAVAYSWTTLVPRPEADRGFQGVAPLCQHDRGQHDRGYMTRYSPARAAAQWNTQNASLHLLAHSQTPVIRVRYEDLVGGVKQTLRKIAGFAGLAVDEQGLAFVGGGEREQWAELRLAHTAAGNPMRFEAGQITVRPDDRWQTEMPGSQRRTVTALTLPLLRHYGYAGGPGGSRAGASAVRGTP